LFGAGLLTPPRSWPQVSGKTGDLRSRPVARSGDRPQRGGATRGASPAA